MVEIKYTLSAENIQRVINACKGFYPIPLDENGNPTAEEGAWAKEKIRQHVIDLVFRWETSEARKTLGVIKDSTLLE